VIVKDTIGERVKTGSRYALTPLQLPSWKTKNARVIATFENGSPAITLNKYGRGTVITILPDALTVAQKIPDLVRDLLDYAVSLQGGTPAVDIVGTNESCDVAVSQTKTELRVAIVNYSAGDAEVMLKPARAPAQGDSEWIDLVSNKTIGTGQSLKVKVLANGFRALEFRR
jgi:hypothetical protein